MDELIEKLKEIRMLIENDELEESIQQIDLLIYQHGETEFFCDDD